MSQSDEPTYRVCAFARCRLIIWRGSITGFNPPQFCRWHREWQRLVGDSTTQVINEREAHDAWFAETQAWYQPQCDPQGHPHEITSDLNWHRLYGGER